MESYFSTQELESYFSHTEPEELSPSDLSRTNLECINDDEFPEIVFREVNFSSNANVSFTGCEDIAPEDVRSGIEDEIGIVLRIMSELMKNKCSINSDTVKIERDSRDLDDILVSLLCSKAVVDNTFYYDIVNLGICCLESLKWNSKK